MKDKIAGLNRENYPLSKINVFSKTNVIIRRKTVISLSKLGLLAVKVFLKL